MKTYIKLAWYSLKKNPFFSFIILSSISITIMVVLFIGSVLETSYGSNGAYKNIDRILIAKILKITRSEERGWSNSPFSYSAYKDYFSKMSLPEKMSISEHHSSSKAYYEELSLKIERMSIDQNFMEMFPFNLQKGRMINENDITERKNIMLITDQMSLDLFGEKDPLGKKIKVNSVIYEIVGVVEKENNFRVDVYADAYTPVNIYQTTDEDWHSFLGSFEMYFLYPNEKMLEAGHDEFQSVVVSLPKDPTKHEKEINAEFMTEKEWLFDNLFSMDNPETYYIYLIIVFGVCMGVPALSLINLNVTRISERAGEIGIRKAFGASKIDILKQLLVENLFTTFLGGIIGYILAVIGVKLMNRYSWFEQGEQIEIYPILLLYGLGCVFIFSLLSGLYPSFKTSNFGISNALKSDKQ